MLKIIFGILLSLFLLLQVGCSVQSSQVVIVDRSSLENRTNTPKIPLNKSAYSKNIFGGSRNCVSQAEDGTEQLARCRVKYYPSRRKNHWSVVKGVLHNGRTYPVILDTGASAAIFVNDVHIRENNLAFYPFKKNNSESVNWGMCDLEGLRIGEISLAGWPCYYQQRHAEARLFGLLIFKDKTIVVGLPVLRQFKYIEFDNVKREVYFSLDRVFEPHESDSWMPYSFVIEEYSQGNTFLLVNIPIAGKETKLQLDTGNSGGLAVGTELWGQISKKIKDFKLAESKDLYPYIDQLACKRGIIPKIDVGDRAVKNVKLSVFTDDSKIMEGCQGLLGMQCFQDTVMVLDFEKSLMWVKSLGSKPT